MAETVDRAVYEIETRRVGDRNAIRGVRDEILSTQQVQRAAQQFDARYASATAEGQRRIMQAERERRQGMAEDLRLLSLRVQTTNLANQSEVAAVRDSLLAQREYQQSARATQQENLRLVQITQQLERRVESYAAAQVRANRVTGQLPVERIRMGGNAISAIAFAAESAALGGRSATIAFGNLAQTLAIVSRNANFAAWAGWIGAAVTVAGTLVSILGRADELEKQRAQRRREREISDLDVHTIDRELARLERQRSAAASAPSFLPQVGVSAPIVRFFQAFFDLGKWGAVKRIETEIATIEERRADLLHEMAQSEARRVRENTHALALAERQATVERDALLNAVQLGQHDAEMLRIEADTAERMQAITREYREQRDAAGHILPLTRDQEAALVRVVMLEGEIAKVRQQAVERQRAEARAQGTIGFMSEYGDARQRFDARMAEIEIQREQEIRLYGDSAIAAERAEIRKRQLYRETAREAAQSFRIIHDALIGSSNKTIRAVAHIADSIRRFHIGAEAALAAVESARAFGKVPLALAERDFVGAALYAKAGFELGAAAALGFREALGGGGGSTAGGGGGAGAGRTFEPRSAEGQGGAQTIVLQLMDPDTPGAIGRTMWLMQRNRVLHRQAYIPVRAA